jgi:hypothetical protein
MHTAEPPPTGQVVTTTTLEPFTGPHAPEITDSSPKKIRIDAESAKSG